MLDVEWDRCKISSGTASPMVAAVKLSVPPTALSPSSRVVVPVSVPELV